MYITWRTFSSIDHSGIAIRGGSEIPADGKNPIIKTAMPIIAAIAPKYIPFMSACEKTSVLKLLYSELQIENCGNFRRAHFSCKLDCQSPRRIYRQNKLFIPMKCTLEYPIFVFFQCV